MFDFSFLSFYRARQSLRVSRVKHIIRIINRHNFVKLVLLALLAEKKDIFLLQVEQLFYVRITWTKLTS